MFRNKIFIFTFIKNLQNSFSGMFGKIAPGMCRLTMNGNIAVKCGNGYKSYNVDKGTLTNVTNFCFNVGDEMFFIIFPNLNILFRNAHSLL